MAIFQKKSIRIPGGGPIWEKGGLIGPINTPYSEDIKTIASMLMSGRQVIEVLNNNTEMNLTLHNYDKDNNPITIEEIIIPEQDNNKVTGDVDTNQDNNKVTGDVDTNQVNNKVTGDVDTNQVNNQFQTNKPQQNLYNNRNNNHNRNNNSSQNPNKSTQTVIKPDTLEQI